jgi:hypothetical protein
VPTAGAILDRFLHHAQTIAITGRSYGLKDHATLSGKEEKPRRSNPSPTTQAARRLRRGETFDRRTGELNGSLSGSARFTLLLTDYGQRSIFDKNWRR